MSQRSTANMPSDPASRPRATVAAAAVLYMYTVQGAPIHIQHLLSVTYVYMSALPCS